MRMELMFKELASKLDLGCMLRRWFTEGRKEGGLHFPDTDLQCHLPFISSVSVVETHSYGDICFNRTILSSDPIMMEVVE